MEFIAQLDQKLFYWINYRDYPQELNLFMQFMSGRAFWLIIAAMGVVYALIKKQKKMLTVFFLLGLSVGASDLITYQVLKPFFARERPCHQGIVRLVPEACGSDWGFPSNHAANSAAVALSIIWHYRRKSVAAVIIGLSIIVSFSRIYLGVHFPFDVLGGWITGLFITSIIHAGYAFLSNKFSKNLTN